MLLSMMDAYIVEQTKYETKTFEQWQAVVVNEMSTIQVDLVHVYNGVYQIQFVTMNGLKNLLRLRYHIEEHMYEVRQNGLFSLMLTHEQKREVELWISSNWTVEGLDGKTNIFVKGK